MRIIRLFSISIIFFCLSAVFADEPKPVKLSDYFPPSESKGGWRSLLPATGVPASGDPDADQKAKIREMAGVDWDKLSAAAEYNRTAEGGSALLVIRRGYVIGEWYKDCRRDQNFNIFSCSKSYTSIAFGLILADINGQGERGVSTPRFSKNGKKLTLDTKICTEDWLPEALPLPDPRKADITLRHLLTMTSGIGGEEPYPFATLEWSLGKFQGSPWSKLKGDPGTVFHYSNAGVTHLALIFRRAAGRDLFPFLKERVFEPIGIEQIRWTPMGDNNWGQVSQGFSGILTTAREHARFMYLAMHRGQWAGKQIVPDAYFDFAWKGTKVKPDYGGLWWVHPHHAEAPKDLVQTAGFRQNHGFAVPSLDLVFVRFGLGFNYPKDFESELVKKVLAAVENDVNTDIKKN
jgi:CubicO group peptidase (beta-lactamase class C family)